MNEYDVSGWERLIRSEWEELKVHLHDEGEKYMSVILFSKDEVYTEMANAYESLKPLLAYYGRQEEQTEEFYSSLRRLYFANVAAWLCQYHDSESPIPASEMVESIDTFELDPGRFQFPNQPLMHLHKLVSAWQRLKYNLTTNGGEQFRPVTSFEFVETIIERLTREVLNREIEQ